MKRPGGILVLAGSTEARAIARALAAVGHEVRAVMSEPPKGSDPMPVLFEVMGQPDAGVLAARMRAVSAVVDASHGFDGAMSVAGFAAAQAADLPILSLARPAWGLEAPGWREARDVAAAMPLIPDGARVFSACGWGSLGACAAFPGERLFLRQTTRHDRQPPFDFVEPVFGEPPFSAESEAALFQALRIDLLICRNLGGRASRPKLDAAKALGVAVVLIARPPLPRELPVVDSVEAVLDWVAGL